VCDADLIAAGAYKAARARGLDIPADLSVTGFDDVLLATALEAGLTTVRLPAEQLGAQGMALPLDLLPGRSPGPPGLAGRLAARACRRAASPPCCSRPRWRLSCPPSGSPPRSWARRAWPFCSTCCPAARRSLASCRASWSSAPPRPRPPGGTGRPEPAAMDFRL